MPAGVQPTPNLSISHAGGRVDRFSVFASQVLRRKIVGLVFSRKATPAEVSHDLLGQMNKTSEWQSAGLRSRTWTSGVCRVSLGHHHNKSDGHKVAVLSLPISLVRAPLIGEWTLIDIENGTSVQALIRCKSIPISVHGWKHDTAIIT